MGDDDHDDHDDGDDHDDDDDDDHATADGWWATSIMSWRLLCFR